MLFHSFDFALFLPVVFLLYWFATGRSLRLQNLLLLAASCVFYGWWDVRFLALMLFSTLVDYAAGRAIAATEAPARRSVWLWSSICVNLGLLFFFKYFNFFTAQFSAAFTWLGRPVSLRTLDLVLPVGISFYTFQTMSYTIDVYRRNIPPCKGFVELAAYVSFFPQLVAGPIERAANLLPQFYAPRRFAYGPAVDGLRQILWGLFKKVVVADGCANNVDILFANPEAHNGSALLFGAVLFAFQIYGDFSGYSDVAIGTARLFGFSLMQNFAFPYFSRDVAEFWRRWHISLSTWFRDYLYIPLGGSRGGRWMGLRNTAIVFLVSGFWHGANWTFIAWGALHALFFAPLLLLGRNRKHLDTAAAGRRLPRASEAASMLGTFLLVCIAWVFFRADSVPDALVYLGRLATPGLFSLPDTLAETALIGVAVMLAFEWPARERAHALENFGGTWPAALRWSVYLALAFSIVLFSGDEKPFIYFQF